MRSLIKPPPSQGTTRRPTWTARTRTCSTSSTWSRTRPRATASPSSSPGSPSTPTTSPPCSSRRALCHRPFPPPRPPASPSHATDTPFVPVCCFIEEFYGRARAQDPVRGGAAPAGAGPLAPLPPPLASVFLSRRETAAPVFSFRVPCSSRRPANPREATLHRMHPSQQ